MIKLVIFDSFGYLRIWEKKTCHLKVAEPNSNHTYGYQKYF